MSTYEPTSRRPIASLFRLTAQHAVRLCIRLGIHPDTISYASMVVAAAAGLCFLFAAERPWLLLVGPVFCLIRLWCNMLDGMVALASGQASARGEILNDLPDRVSDVLIFAGLAHGGLGLLPLGYWAAIMALLTAYVGTFGQAVGGRREFGGVMSKPWRMVVVCVGAFVAYAVELPGPLTLIDWACIVVIAGCLQTIAVRLRRIFAAVAVRDGEGES